MLAAALQKWLRGSAGRPEQPEQRTHRCPLCGHAFTDGEGEACAGCPLLRRCGLVMCPKCSHEFPPG